MFADVTCGSTSSSAPISYAPKLSPMSQLMSTRIASSVVVQRDRRAYLAEVVFAGKVQPLCLRQRDRAKAKAISGLELSNHWKIHGRNLGDAWIAARRLTISHEDDRIPARWKLHGAKGHRLGENLARRFERERRSFEPIAHPIGLRADAKLGAPQLLRRFRREESRVLPLDYPDHGRRCVAWQQRCRSTPMRDRHPVPAAISGHGVRDPASQLSRIADREPVSASQCPTVNPA